ncbi:MAG: hypothetical protein VZR53_15935, partial [Prevotella sp.]|nr:hypothetical protein [Prevotella sp.]
ITLEFTKNTKVEGTPRLNLNNGGTATYKADYGDDYGNGHAIHVFEYTVGTVSAESSEKDTADISDKCLSVSSIDLNGAVWKDIDTDVTDAIYNPEDSNNATKFAAIPNLKGNRSIIIDRKAPAIKTISKVTSDGWYKKDASILLMLEFDEAVSITNAAKMKLKFNHNNAETSNAEESGSKYVLFTYNVAAGHNADSLEVIKLEKEDGAVVTDMAGNSFEGWGNNLSYSFDGIHIDTTAPKAPKFVTESGTEWKPDDVIFDSDGTSFYLTNNGETNIESMEYSIEEGSWITYSGKVPLSNDGQYTVKVRQTDKAGNVTSEADINDAAKSFIIDKGQLLTRITAETVSGAYSRNTNTKVIKGRIEFGKTVQIEKEAKVTLNVKHTKQGNSDSKSNSDTQDVEIIECNTDTAKNKGYAEGNLFTFEFPITEGDNTDGYLDVTAFSFSKVTLQGKEIRISVPEEGEDKRFNENRSIEIITGIPKVETDGITLTGEGENAVLTVTFDREITKVGGEITFTQFNDSTDAGKYRVPAVLSVDEYNELKSNATIAAAYEKGVNGATKNGTSLVNDTTTKYILNFKKDDTNSELVSAFTSEPIHRDVVTVPVVSSNVSTSGKVLTIALGDTYKLPVKGAKYTLSIPANCVTDKVQNKNAGKNDTVTAAGVEAPVIRMYKPSYEITGISGSKNIEANTKDAAADMTKAQSAQIRIDCQTPGATIKYGTKQLLINGSDGTTVTTVNTRSKYTTKTTDASIPTTINNNYTADNKITLASGDDSYKVDSYEHAFGMKIAIAATATANGKTETAYEYAARTVLKFHIGTYSGDGASILSADVDNLTFKDLKVWVIGGDSAYGSNTIDPFPLSWGDSSKFKMMSGDISEGDWANDRDHSKGHKLKGDFYWVTWDITAATYHGFIIGDVPSDAAAHGPTTWFVGECCWVPLKENYPLYPGETIIMDTSTTDADTPAFLFRYKNKGTR